MQYWFYVSLFILCSLCQNLISRGCGEFPLWLSGWQTQLRFMRTWVRSLAFLSGLRIHRYLELWCRSQTQLGSGVAWLWCRLAATTLIQPLAQEPPYAMGVALKRPKKKKIKSMWAFWYLKYILFCSSSNLNSDSLLLENDCWSLARKDVWRTSLFPNKGKWE